MQFVRNQLGIARSAAALRARVSEGEFRLIRGESKDLGFAAAELLQQGLEFHAGRL